MDKKNAFWTFKVPFLVQKTNKCNVKGQKMSKPIFLGSKKRIQEIE